MPRWIFGLSMFLTTMTAGSFSQTLDKEISDLIKAQEPVAQMGIAIAIIKDGKTLISKGYGYRDRAKKLPVTKETLFAIGSATKAFAATSFLLLEEDGKIDLTKAINRSRTFIELSDESITNELSVTDILSHRSALSGNDFLWILAPFTKEELLKKLPLLPLKKASFRKVSQYNNILYMALADVFLDAADETWPSYLSRKLLKPLGMKSTTTSSKKVLEESDYALAYFAQNEIKRREIDWIGPAGALNSNLQDITRWLTFHLAKGKNEEGKQLLQLDRLNRLYSTQADVPGAMQFAFQGLGWFGQTLHYGLGWFLGEVRGHRAIFHSGNIDGYSSLVVFIPDLDIGTVILTNQSVSSFPGKLAQEALGFALNTKIEDSFQLPQFPTPTEEPDVAFDFDPKTLTGIYLHDVYGSIEMKCENSTLELLYYGHRMPLRYKGNGVFDFSVSLFGGYLIPMKATLDQWKDTAPTSIAIPFALDPELPSVVFKRLFK